MTTSQTSRWMQWALSAALLLAALAITIIVSLEMMSEQETGMLVKQQRKVETQAWIVSTLVSEPSETKEAFVRRLAIYMQAWTQEHGAEVCGFLATDGERWGVRLTTQKSQAFCFFAAAMVPEGMTATPETIHTHPSAKNGWLAVNDSTRAAAKAIGDYKLGSRGTHWMKVEPGFSGDDYNAGPGYLVVDGRVLHQAGRGTEREVSVSLLAQTENHAQGIAQSYVP